MMSDRIKSAYEKALERFSQIKQLPEDEILRLEYYPLGQTIGRRFLQEKNMNLAEEILKHEYKARVYLVEGIEDVLLRNITLPVNEQARETARRAGEGLLAIKRDKRRVIEALGELEYFYNYFEQARQQAYRNLQEEFTARMVQARQKLGLRGNANYRPDVEKSPVFREEWQKLLHRLEASFEENLQQIKEKIKSIE